MSHTTVVPVGACALVLAVAGGVGFAHAASPEPIDRQPAAVDIDLAVARAAADARAAGSDKLAPAPTGRIGETR